MEAVVLVAIAVLSVVFLGSLLGLIIVCRHKYCRPFDLISNQFKDTRPEINLINNEDNIDMELDDVRLHPNIEKILADEQWVDDATGLIPHCLAILKKCHHLTERLVAMMMTHVSQHSQDLGEIIEVAKKISPRVDDVVRAMYPPLDPRLLEARCIALILSVNHLALVTRTLCQWRTTCSWIEAALTDMEDNLQVLREAGMSMENVTSQAGNTSTLEYPSAITPTNFITGHQSFQLSLLIAFCRVCKSRFISRPLVFLLYLCFRVLSLICLLPAILC